LKWYLYWTTLVALLLGGLYTKNQYKHKQKSIQWKIGKSVIECALLVLAVIFMPPVLVVYGSMWATKKITRPGFRIAASFTVGTLLMLTIGWALEVLVLVGIFSIDMISDDFLGYMHERRAQKEAEMLRAVAWG